MRKRLQQTGGSSVYVHSATCNVMLKSYSGVRSTNAVMSMLCVLQNWKVASLDQGVIAPSWQYKQYNCTVVRYFARPHDVFVDDWMPHDLSKPKCR